MIARLKRLPARLRDAIDLRRIHGYLDIQGWLTPNEALCLFRLARALPPGSTVVEIGSWKGKSTYCLARGLRDGKIIAIDPFDASGEPGSAELYGAEKSDADLFESFKSRMQSLGVDSKIEPWRGYSREFTDRLPPIDLLFIDGDHSIAGCREDFENYAPRVTSGGYVLFHDYDPARLDLGPTWVIDHLVIPSPAFTPAGRADSIWFARKT